MDERLEQRPSELDQKVVLIRAPLDVEQGVNKVIGVAGTRNEQGAPVSPGVDETAVREVPGSGRPREGPALHVTHDKAALEVLGVILQAI